ncbi:beta-galactosidase [Tamlana nanhaiensis]|uniref:Beta-galactosidase n=1 Tax=Neotamlana nanhaiensis TaxID=1382798 RepID=A0A0D7VXJ3_9FLAO|nr:sugar-binding domain-containing protein [Tamlana nanhaiensis]KJD31605.1 beta-galactosidase [Tamlana nanhaiensis]
MRQKKFLFIITYICFVSTIFSQIETNQREKLNFNYGWKLHVGDANNAQQLQYNDASWKKVNLPFAWNQDEAFKLDITELSTGIAWYRKSFSLPEHFNNQNVFIEFEGVRQMGEVYINDTFIGRHENGVMAFGFNITPYLKPYPEKNVIAVKTDNDWRYKEQLTGSGFQWNNKNFNANYGGIPKNVYLHITPKVYQTLPLYTTLGTTGTYVYASDFDIDNQEAVIHVSSQIKNETLKPVEAQLQVKVEDMDGNIISTFTGDKTMISPNGMFDISAANKVSSLNFWSWGYGYLYKVHSQLLVNGESTDEVVVKTGFRKTKFHKGMIYLNNRVIMVKGYAQRTSNEWPSVGMSVPAWVSDYSNKLMIESNGNLVRWMHVTPWKQDVESCDRVGLIQAMPAGDSESDVTGRRWTQRLELMRDAIIYNRNNPSIIFYESGNESISEAHMQEMLAIKNQYDPYGGRAIGSREMLDSRVAEYGGEMLYINKSERIPFWATEYSRDEGLRKYWDEFTPPYHKEGSGGTTHENVNGTNVKDASAYNHNQDAHAIEDVVRWYDYYEMRPGTGERVSSGGVNIVFSDTNTHYRGAENYRRSGEVDPMRIPKDGFYAHQVMWDGWVDIENPRAHILGHWNYESGVVKDITVISSADEIELFVNGKSLGKGEQSKQFLFTFKDVAFKAGNIKAVGYNKSGAKICEAEKITAGKPAKVKLTTLERPGGSLANASDLVIVQVEVVDAKGNRCPTALNMIDFDVKGAGEFVGGIAKGPDNYIGSKQIPVECGVNRVFVRTTDKAGTIKVEATSKGLKKASVSIKTHETDLSALSKEIPSESLPSNFEKGATPKTKSYTKTRQAVAIVSATANSNADEVAKSFDDNELTEWGNVNGETSTITYALAHEAKINQVVLKLSGWRRRQYPIRISVDNKIVYQGLTELSLGYVTLNVEETTGKNVKIELVGEATDSDAINLVEITGKVDAAGLKESSNVKQLRIVEVEFYESL